MSPKTILKLEKALAAVNAVNDAFRAELKKHGIETAESYLRISENKPMLKKLLAAEA
ncbi:MAG TPA: hypothetical protein VGK22_03830 [Candidatus Angelobacter sp.]|jgi:hypothetical protein